MRKRIKGAIGAALIALTLGSGAYAADFGASYNVQDNKIIITSDIEENGFGTFVYVLKGALEDKKLSEVLTAENVIYAGKIRNEIPMPEDAENGVYSVVFCTKNLPAEAERCVYVLKVDRQAQTDAIKAVFGAANAEDMLNALKTGNNDVYVLDLTDAELKAQYLYDVVKYEGLDKLSEPTFDDLQAAYNLASDLQKMQTAAGEELETLLKNNKGILNIDGVENCAAETANGIVSARTKGAEFDTLSAQQKTARQQLALAALNKAGKDELYSTVEKYNDVFNIEFSAKKSKVSEYDVAKALSEVVFDDVTKVESIINNAIEEVYKKNGKGGSSGGSSGGSGGGGSSRSGGYGAPSIVSKPELNENSGENAVPLTDLAGYDWANEAIEYLYENGVMTGDGDGSFRPGDTLAREELVKILIAAFNKGKTENASTSFVDVMDEWYKPYVETAYAKGIIKGKSETEFGIGEAVTREDASVMIVRTAEAYYKTFNKGQTLVDIPDFDSVAEYAKESVDMLTRAKIISGFEDGTFRPAQSVTRAEAAKMIYNCIMNLNSVVKEG